MKISGYRLAMLRAPLREVFTTALRRVDQVEDVVLLLESDCGRVGYGSAPATEAITGADHASIVKALKNELLPQVVGRHCDSLAAMVADLSGGNNNARSALETALFDLAAQDAGLPLCRFLGGEPVTLGTSLTLSVNTPDDMAASARVALARGFTRLKVKIGGEPAEDVARVKQVVAAVDGKASIYLDANQAWTQEQAVQVMGLLQRSGVTAELLEQPLPAADKAGLAHLRQRLTTPIMADESVFSAADAAALVELGAADILNIKLVKSGGITGALAIADVAAGARIPCMMGCMLESAVGVSAAAHLAAARPATITRVDLDAPLLASHNPVRGGCVFNGPRVEINQAPGLGIRGINGLEYL